MFQQTPLEHRLSRLTAEIQDLRAEIRAAVGHLPKPGRRWISTTALASEIGVSSRAVLNWITAGRFPEAVVKKRPRGDGYVYLLDRGPAIAAAERIFCGDL